VEEKYPGESQWYQMHCMTKRLIVRIQQIAAAEDQMRAEGKIDKEGHLKKKNGKNGKNSKNQEKRDQ